MIQFFARPGVTAALLGLSVAVMSVSAAHAQRPYQPYRSPYGPTLPGELDYFRRDTGVLPNYYNFIQPQRQLRQQLYQLDQQYSQQQVQLRQMQTQWQQGLSQRGSGARPTGVGGNFMNYSHYYSGR